MKKSIILKPFGIVLIVVATLIISLLLFNVKFKSETLGQFGDFYGGILGTIITFAGLYFIYKTYATQSEQLKIAKSEADLEMINKLYNDLLKEIESVQYRKSKNEKGQVIMHDTLYRGNDALYNFDNAHWNNPNSVINHLNAIALSFEQILFLIKKVQYRDIKMKEILLSKVYFLFYAKILWPAYSIYDKSEELGLGKNNQDATLFFRCYEKLTKESITFLLGTKRINFPDNEKIAKLVTTS